jgi:hypothetical protein
MGVDVQFSAAVLVAHVIQWLKGQKWFPFAQLNAFWLNVGTAIVGSLASSGALLYTYSPGGDFSLHGNIFTVIMVLKTAAVQYAFQHFVYHASVKQ